MESNNVELNKKQKIIFLGITVVLVLISIFITTYAFFSYTRTGDRNTIKTGKIYLNFSEGTNNLSLTNQFPIPDVEAYNQESSGEEVTITDFTVTGYSTSSEPLNYKVSVVKGEIDSSRNRFPDDQVKLYLIGETNGKGSLTIENGYGTNDATQGIYGELISVGNDGIDTIDNGEVIIATGQVGKEEATHNYTLRMWISDQVTISDTNSAYTYCASQIECNDDRKIYSTMYYSLKVKVQNIEN